MNKIAIKNWRELADRTPADALIVNADLVIVRYDDNTPLTTSCYPNLALC